ncbi:MAG: proline--tRNA ligase [Candidatus Carbobacillus altaicus]|nr:proline--tRNA ligase [Candidatus Carbobacillus altaicus]
MRQSQAFIPTMREVPKDADVVSHQLLLRAGYIRQLSSGVYSYLPLAYRVLNKIMRIVQEEMDAIGGQAVLLPALQPQELWQATGRWDDYGPLMMKLKDRHERLFALGPTHEEVITALVRDEVKTYKRLPLILYQIQTKYRDEYRPRFGLLRGREFIMKDAYSFDRDEEGLDQSYWAMYHAYERIFQRMGLSFRAVEADSGAIGGSHNHEFMVLSSVGEDTIAYCSACDYAANVERCEVSPPKPDTVIRDDVLNAAELPPRKEVPTPGIRTVAEQARMLGLKEADIIKNVVVMADGEPVLVLIRGDHQMNEVKVKNVLGARQVEMASEEDIRRLFQTSPGFVGPIGITGIKIIADWAISTMRRASTGANRDDWHYIEVNPERDFKVDLYADLRVAMHGDRCPRCDAPLQFTQGIEVGHVFKLGSKYSRALGATYLDEEGIAREMMMGSYGIGISRVMQAAIEQSHDAEGIIWPMAIAPFEVHLIVAAEQDEGQRSLGEALYAELRDSGWEVLYDDRSERAGVKFKDADLIGIPLRVVVGKDSAQGLFEIKVRKTGQTYKVSRNELEPLLRNLKHDVSALVADED